MSEPVRFLTSLAHALSTLGLYGAEHPAAVRAAESAYRRLEDLRRDRPAVTFTFLPGEVLYGPDLVRDLERWEWSLRFARAGIERLEMTGPVSEEHFARFVARAATILGISGDGENDLWQDGPEGIRFGRVQVAETNAPATADPEPVEASALSLREERDAVEWMHTEVQAGRPIPVLEAYTVVRSLSLAMHGGQAIMVPLLQLKEFDQYTTTHSMNVSVLAMALAEFLTLPAPAVRAFGVAGLLHDLGKVRIPREILTKAGKLTPEERGVIETHPVEGARILLEGSEPLDLAASVAMSTIAATMAADGLHPRRRRPVRPFLHRQQENRHSLRVVLDSQQRRVRPVCAPRFRIRCRNEEHHVRMPVPVAIAQVPLLRHHVAHRAGFHLRQFSVVERGFDLVGDLPFRESGQGPLGLLKRARQVRPRRRGVEADRGTDLGIPELRIVRPRRPPPLHRAHEAVLPFHRRLKPVLSQRQNLRIARDRRGSRTPR